MMDREMEEAGHRHPHESMEHADPHATMMKMFFHFGYGDTLLFPGLTIDSGIKMALSCSVLFVLAIFLEFLNYVRRIRCECELRPLNVGKDKEHDHVELNGSREGAASSHCQQQARGSAVGEKTRRCCSRENSENTRSKGCPMKHCEFSLFRFDSCFYRCLQAFLYLFQTFLALTLMLAAMTYNVCIIFAIVLGAGVGYFLFYRPIVDVQLCH